MKFYKLLLLLLISVIPVLNFAQDKDKIANFVNEVYGKKFYFLDNTVGQVVVDELNEDWGQVLTQEERESYKNALKSQVKKYNWQDLKLKKAILCINGKPIVSEENIPLESLIFSPQNKDGENFYDNKLFTIYYRGKDLTEEKKSELHRKFLKKLSKRNYNAQNIVRISQPIFFGDNYVLTTKYSKSLGGSTTSVCVFKFESNNWKEIDCMNIQRHTQEASTK